MTHEMQEKILSILKEKPMQYTTHEELACRIAPRGITFFRAMQDLTASGRIEQSITNGYKAKT
jgi:hypothetical protein